METERHHWKQFCNPAYIGAYSLDGKDLTVRIVSVKQEIVKGDGGKEEMCMVAQLKNNKPLILNRTNSKTITKIYETPYVEEWAGKLITLYPTTTKVAGEVVECLRIRTVKPQEKAKPDMTKHISSLRACTTLEELQKAYTGLSKEEQVLTVSVKDEMKAKLMPAPTTIVDPTPPENPVQ